MSAFRCEWEELQSLTHTDTAELLAAIRLRKVWMPSVIHRLVKPPGSNDCLQCFGHADSQIQWAIKQSKKTWISERDLRKWGSGVGRDGQNITEDGRKAITRHYKHAYNFQRIHNWYGRHYLKSYNSSWNRSIRKQNTRLLKKASSTFLHKIRH